MLLKMATYKYSIYTKLIISAINLRQCYFCNLKFELRIKLKKELNIHSVNLTPCKIKCKRLIDYYFVIYPSLKYYFNNIKMLYLKGKVAKSRYC